MRGCFAHFWPIYQPHHFQRCLWLYCVGFDFADSDIVVGIFYRIYYLGY